MSLVDLVTCPFSKVKSLEVFVRKEKIIPLVSQMRYRSAQNGGSGGGSGGGYDSASGWSSAGMDECPAGDTIEIALLSILAAFVVAFAILYRTFTLETGGRRFSRSLANDENREIQVIADYLWHGKKFET